MRIESYPDDNNISLQDRVTGSDADNSKKTKNYTFQAIKDFFIAQGFGTNSNTTPVETIYPYKVYTVIFSQLDINAPTVIVLQNTLGGTVIWSRTGVGTYVATLSSAFTLDKTAVLITKGQENDTGIFMGGFRQSVNTVVIYNNNGGGFPFSTDGEFTNATIEIRVYN